MGENIDLGDNVEFTIQTRNGKEVATNIIKLVTGTVVFEDVGTEYFRGQVLKVRSQKKLKKRQIFGHTGLTQRLFNIKKSLTNPRLFELLKII